MGNKSGLIRIVWLVGGGGEEYACAYWSKMVNGKALNCSLWRGQGWGGGGVGGWLWLCDRQACTSLSNFMSERGEFMCLDST